MTDSKLEPLRERANKAVMAKVCPDDYDDRYLPQRLRQAVDVTFDVFAEALEETKVEDWHEQDCGTADGPPGPFPCDCKISKGWTVFLLAPPKIEEKSFVGFVKHNGAGELLFKQASYYGAPAHQTTLKSLLDDGWTPVYTGESGRLDVL